MAEGFDQAGSCIRTNLVGLTQVECRLSCKLASLHEFVILCISDDRRITTEQHHILRTNQEVRLQVAAE